MISLKSSLHFYVGLLRNFPHHEMDRPHTSRAFCLPSESVCLQGVPETTYQSVQGMRARKKMKQNTYLTAIPFCVSLANVSTPLLFLSGSFFMSACAHGGHIAVSSA